MKAVEVVGGGLIGTSIALKVASCGGHVRVVDDNPAHQRVANGLLGSHLLPSSSEPELVVVATPVDTLAIAISEALCRYPRAIVIDTGSIKTKVLLEVSTYLEKNSMTERLSDFVPTHPMAGRELSGPDGARSDLFEGRAWAITPHPALSPQALAAVEDFIEALGATSYELTPVDHDRQVAMTSHLPQLLASALAAILEEPLDLAGQGLRDMTRLAHSDGGMWAPIFEGNHEALEPLVEQLVKSINELKNKAFKRDAILSFMAAGIAGASKIPGKHGGNPRNYGSLSVVISDQPGQLAKLFNHCADGKFNIEDLRIEHSPGQETGLISLYVQPGDLSTLNDYLSIRGWHTTIISKGI